VASKRRPQSDRGAPRKARAQRRGGCLFWAVIAIVALSVAIAARKPLEEAVGRLFGGKAGGTPTVEVKPAPTPAAPAPGPAAPTPAGTRDAARGGSAAVTAVPGTGAAQPAAQPERKPGTPAAPERAAARKATLFFAHVASDGKIALKGVVRPIPASDSPLRDTIQTLLAGPTSREVNQGLLTMISSDVRLRSVVVQGDTAVIDFSESFRFSTLGQEGLNTRLEQVVYAATDFPTVRKVQILIEGKKVQYLGPEGIRIDSPLGRASFPEQSPDPSR
jgi:germination protein M